MFFRILLYLIAGLVSLLLAFFSGLTARDLWRGFRFLWSARRLAPPEDKEEDITSKNLSKKLTPEEAEAHERALLAQLYRPGLSRAKLNALQAFVDRPDHFFLDTWHWRLWWRGWWRLATEASGTLQQEATRFVIREGKSRRARLSSADLDRLIELLPEQEAIPLELEWTKERLSILPFRAEARRRLEALGQRQDHFGARALCQLLDHLIEQKDRESAISLLAQYRALHPEKHAFAQEQALCELLSPRVRHVPLAGLHIVWGFSTSKLSFDLKTSRFKPTEGNATGWLNSPPEPSRGQEGEAVLQRELSSLALPFSVQAAVFRLPPDLRGVFFLDLNAAPAPPPRFARLFPDLEISGETHREYLQKTRLDAVIGLTEEKASLWVLDMDTRRPAQGLPVTFWLRTKDSAVPTGIQRTTDRDGLATIELKQAWQVGASVHRFNPRGAEEFLFLTHSEDIRTTIPATPEERLYVWLARPLYRPGEIVQGKLIGRHKGSDSPSHRFHQGRRVELQIRGPRGAVLAELKPEFSRFGTASFSFPVPAGSTLGKYTFHLRYPSSTTQIEGSFHVEEFVAPEFKATLRNESPPRWGKTTSLVFKASYFFGGPVKNASGQLEISRQSWTQLRTPEGPPPRIHEGSKTLDPISFRTDDDGHAEITLPWLAPLDLFRLQDGFDLSLKAVLRDDSGKTCEALLTLTFGRCAHALEITPTETLRRPGEPIELKLRWFPGDEQESTEYDLRLTLQRGWERHHHRLRVSTRDRSVTLPQGLAPGLWKLSANLSGQRSPTQHPRDIWVLGEQLTSPDPRLLLSRKQLAPQEPARIAFASPQGPAPLSVLLLINRGSALESRVISSEATGAWIELPVPHGQGPKVHVTAWIVWPQKDFLLHSWSDTIDIDEPASADASSLPIHLDFPSSTASPGETTLLTSALLEPISGPGELVCSVVDEAIFSIVPAPPSPLDFFEKNPPSPLRIPALCLRWEYAQQGRHRTAHTFPDLEGNYEWDSIDEAAFGARASLSSPMQEEEALKSAAPMAAPRAAPGAGAPMPAMGAPRSARQELIMQDAFAMVAPTKKSVDLRLRRKSADEGGGAEGNAVFQESPVDDTPVALRSDFSSEAAWYPETLIDNANQVTLAVKLPDTLTTWKASALVLTLDERMGEAEARIQTRKPLMIRLQMPRFFQERDVFQLRALVDNPSEDALQVRAKLEAPGLRMQEEPAFSFALEAGAQRKIETQATVLALEEHETTIRAEARSAQGATDAEERRIPYRPYGSLQRVTRQGLLTNERERVVLELPENRQKEQTRLEIRVDRGPLDAVLHALNYLREYPYGCVEQTCSRLIPHLVWERVLGLQKKEATDASYRAAEKPSHNKAIDEALEQLLSRQNPDGGFGWWPARSSDLWMAAYVLFSFSLVNRASRPGLQNTIRFIRAHLLDANNADDADAFAAFALAWCGESVEERVFQVLLPRWENLSLTEQVKLCLPLRAAKHPEASARTASVRRKLVRGARKFLRQIEDDSILPGGWFEPRATEAVAFFVMVLLHPSSTPDPDAPEGDEEALSLLLSFLLMHRSGTRWHSTRDTALAVLAMLLHEERFSEKIKEISLRIAINERPLPPQALGGIMDRATSVVLRDSDLRGGKNPVDLSLEGTAGGALPQRHYALELEYISQEDQIEAREEGLSLERTYWLLDQRNEPARKLKSGERVRVGQRLRVQLAAKSEKLRRYLLLEDPKLAGCEPLAKTSGPEVCTGRCEHVELRADRTAIFVNLLWNDEERLSYDIEAQIPGHFTAMPARMEPMYDSGCSGTSASFSLYIDP